jgi:hypothetical protein
VVNHHIHQINLIHLKICFNSESVLKSNKEDVYSFGVPFSFDRAFLFEKKKKKIQCKSTTLSLFFLEIKNNNNQPEHIVQHKSNRVS